MQHYLVVVGGVVIPDPQGFLLALCSGNYSIAGMESGSVGKSAIFLAQCKTIFLDFRGTVDIIEQSEWKQIFKKLNRIALYGVYVCLLDCETKYIK